MASRLTDDGIMAPICEAFHVTQSRTIIDLEHRKDLDVVNRSIQINDDRCVTSYQHFSVASCLTVPASLYFMDP
jgi:hypothetical protein